MDQVYALLKGNTIKEKSGWNTEHLNSEDTLEFFMP